MLHQAQLGQERSKRGYTLLEIIIAVAIVCVLLSMVMASYKIRIDKARLEQTVTEMMAIAQASIDYYNSQYPKVWPANTSQLASHTVGAPNYMYNAVTSSPFGGKYQIIIGLNNSVTISTTVPSGLAEHYYQGALLEILPGNSQDTIEITQQLPNEFSGRLEYENKYLYQQ